MILAIETAISGGSLCIHDGVKAIAVVKGNEGISRADDLLVRVDTALRSAGASLSAEDTVAVSIGPGSYTGIRIGIAAALGLSSAVSAGRVGVAVLEALAFESEPESDVISVIQLRKGEVAWQHFTQDSKYESSPRRPLSGTYDAFGQFLSANMNAPIVCDEFVNVEMSGLPFAGFERRLHVYHASFAEAIANAALGRYVREPIPLYLNASGGRF